jgi:hypothetical protein
MLRRAIGIAAALVMLAAAVVVVPQRGTADNNKDVLVVNGPNQPVPVKLPAGTNVGIDGTPNVNVANTPTVNLAPGANVGITGPLSLAPGTLVDTRIVNDAAQPLEVQVELRIPAGQLVAQTDAVTVPPGKRFILEDVSGSAIFPDDHMVTDAYLTLPNGQGIAPEIDFVPTPTASGVFTFGRAVRGYTDTKVIAHARRDTIAGEVAAYFTIAGHFVDQ